VCRRILYCISLLCIQTTTSAEDDSDATLDSDDDTENEQQRRNRSPIGPSMLGRIDADLVRCICNDSNDHDLMCQVLLCYACVRVINCYCCLV
jgi:hypothetical protein